MNLANNTTSIVDEAAAHLAMHGGQTIDPIAWDDASTDLLLWSLRLRQMRSQIL